MKEEKIFRQIHVPRFVKSHFESKNRENQKKTEKKREIPLLLEKSFLKKGNKWCCRIKHIRKRMMKFINIHIGEEETWRKLKYVLLMITGSLSAY
ncbi:hypothetical protein BVL54_17190 [Bacillus paralicheniformis]|nr:hypothetical protein BVL54_17190 [Bacillus paralicheniformis]